MEKLIKFIGDHSGDDISRLILDRKKYPDIDIDLAVNCIESRRKLKGKVEEWYLEGRLIFPAKLSAEQCSSSATGAYKAAVAERIAVGSLDYARDDKEEAAQDDKEKAARDDKEEAARDDKEETARDDKEKAARDDKEKAAQDDKEEAARDDKEDRGDNYGWSIADLTGGLGVDSWYFSKKASKVIYNEMQTPLCRAARHNFNILGSENIEILNFKAAEGNIGKIIGDKVDIIYMDPARRGDGGKKVFLIEDCTPDVLTLKDEIFRYTDNILIKLSPMADITMVCNRLGATCREVHVVATGGECKELLIWMDRKWNAEYIITAVELHGQDQIATLSFKPSEERAAAVSFKSDSQDRYLFEPGKALMKAGAFNLIGSRFGISKIGASTHYYTTSCEKTASILKDYGKVYEILESHSLDKRSIKAIGNKYPKAEVSARNIHMDTDTLRKKLGVTSGDDAHIFGLKSDSEGNILIAAKRTL